MPSILTAIIHYQTPELVTQAVESFRLHEPTAALLLVDNGSSDGSAEIVRGLADADPHTAARLLETNIFHGPAMDLVLQETDAEAVFFLDSDTITRKSGFLSPMARDAVASGAWACGQVTHADRRGFASRSGTPVPVSAYMMINTQAYRSLPPFIHHGLPVLQTSIAAAERGLSVTSFPVESHIDHLGRGTAERYGYGLGWRSRLNYLLHRFGL